MFEHMKSYGDPVTVELAREAPARFWWRGRRYAVTQVLDHWLVRGAWWDSPSPTLDAEQEIWRAEATAGRSLGVFDLCFDWASGGWSLVVHD
ncbi:MAG: hypothetical protein QOI42_981 [Frankiaceae bacterium]|jgi:hypothetical protein|nr:hypothetical protein [Frankiaceae bacterium]